MQHPPLCGALGACLALWRSLKTCECGRGQGAKNDSEGRARSSPGWPGATWPRRQGPQRSGSRPSPTEQLAAWGLGLRSRDENANLQLAGSAKQIRGDKTAQSQHLGPRLFSKPAPD